jgi:hypothetical protein
MPQTINPLYSLCQAAPANVELRQAHIKKRRRDKRAFLNETHTFVRTEGGKATSLRRPMLGKQAVALNRRLWDEYLDRGAVGKIAKWVEAK